MLLQFLHIAELRSKLSSIQCLFSNFYSNFEYLSNYKARPRLSYVFMSSCALILYEYMEQRIDRYNKTFHLRTHHSFPLHNFNDQDYGINGGFTLHVAE